MPCEDYPCCGHGTNEHGMPDCPDSNGQFTCVCCGKNLLENTTSSICRKCTNKKAYNDDYFGEDYDYSINY